MPNSLQFLAIKHDFICFQHCWNVSTAALTQRRCNYVCTSMEARCSKWTFRPIRKKNVWKKIVKRKKDVGLSMREPATDIWNFRCSSPMYMLNYLEKYYRSCEQRKYCNRSNLDDGIISLPCSKPLSGFSLKLEWVSSDARAVAE